ncbi:aldo/keto reductase [Bosea sp. LjRoot90]|uniref:aldo/keto reductase n=1 Tax=Bosea sp. LjRoot90 TaxID=3342342 RepID=UPI003ED03C57
MTTSTLPVRPLGRSGLEVTTLGFGGAPLGDLFARLDEATAVATVEAALAAGVNLIDTSPLYGHGLSEHRIGAGLRRSGRKDVVISTKVGRIAEPFAGRGDGSGYLGGLPHGLRFDYSYDGTMRSLEQSALRLGVDRIDVVLIHDVDVWTHGADQIENRFVEAMAGAYRALDRLRSAGAVKAIGVGVNEAEMCERFANAGDFDTMLLAGRYSLLEQPGLASFMPLAQKKGIGLMLGGVFNSGILATGPVAGAKYNYQPAPPDILARVAAIEAVCTRHGVPLRRAALQFPLGHPAVASLVMGAVKPEEVEDQAAELAAEIPAALWAELKSEGLLGADVPVPR